MFALPVFFTFTALSAWTLLSRAERSKTLSRSRSDWILDFTGLLFQGLLIPLLQLSWVGALGSWAAPQLKGSLHLSAFFSFLLCFVGVDYLYYWNHRLLHQPKAWALHRVHHSAKRVDVFTTSRNTLWTPFFIVYLWVNGLFIFILADPWPFLAAMALTSCLDLWRHGPQGTHAPVWLKRLSIVLITPHEHHWHHSREKAGINFGANLSIWDRLHGTLYSPENAPKTFGNDVDLSLIRKLLAP